MGQRIEEWRDVKGFEGLYQVNNYGQVKSLRKDALLKPAKSKYGYMLCVLCKNGVMHDRRVHRLVAEAFLENPRSLPQVNHKDGNKSNNNVENLEWCTCSENSRHAVENGLFSTNKRVRVVETGKVYESIGSCARDISGNGQNISHCLHGERKTHKGYHFEWEEAI